MSATNYRGPAMLALSGEDYAVHIDLVVDNASVLRSWEASVTGEMPMPLPDNAVLRLPDGRAGQCLLTDPSFSSSSPTRWTGRLVSSGDLS